MAKVPIPNISNTIDAFYLRNMFVPPCFNTPCLQSCSIAFTFSPWELTLNSSPSYVQDFSLVKSNGKRLKTHMHEGIQTCRLRLFHNHCKKIVTLLNPSAFSQWILLCLQKILFACFAFLKSSSIKIYRQWSKCFQLFTLINCIKLSCLPESYFPAPWPVFQPLLGSSPIFSHTFSSLISKIEHLLMVCPAPHREARFPSTSTDTLFIYVCNF